MGHPSKGNQGGSKDDNPGASASRWRHQESSRYARHAADTVGNPPMSQIRPANEHAGTSDLTSFLNTTRIEGTGPPLSEKSGQASAGGRPYHPITADGYGLLHHRLLDLVAPRLVAPSRLRESQRQRCRRKLSTGKRFAAGLC
jgi:hypothetical protein